MSYIQCVLFRENFHPFQFNTYRILDHFQKLIKRLLKGIPTCSTAQQKLKQNTLVSLRSKNKKTWSLREETNSPLSVASPHKLSTISVLILDEQQKSSYTGNQTYPIIQKGGRCLQGAAIIFSPTQYYNISQSTNPQFIFLVMQTAEFRNTGGAFTVLYLFLLATLAAWLCGWQYQLVCWSVHHLDQTEISTIGWTA